MANKKDVKAEEPIQEAADEKVNQETADVKAEEPIQEAPKSAWDEKVSMLVPRRPHGQDQSYFICVNDRRFGVPANGKVQELPKPVAEILQQSIDAEYRYDEYLEEMRRKAQEAAKAL